MMNQNPQHTQETSYHDLEIPEACMSCGGPLATRFTPGRAHAVCKACRRIMSMTIARGDDGLQIVQEPAGRA